MAIFSSRPPFNDDPKPYALYEDHQYVERFSNYLPPHLDRYTGRYVATYHDPRPEFDRPQNNPTNPILAYAREYHADRFLTSGMVASVILRNWDLLFTVEGATAHERYHARRVLTRLARFAEVNA